MPWQKGLLCPHGRKFPFEDLFNIWNFDEFKGLYQPDHRGLTHYAYRIQNEIIFQRDLSGEKK